MRAFNLNVALINRMTVENELLLFKAVSKGDEAAFRQLFDRYKGKLFGLALSLTKSTVIAEELLQEVFISLWVSRALLSNVRDPAAYIYQSTYRMLRRLVQKEQHQQIILKAIEAQSQPHLAAPDPEIQLLLSETRRILDEAVSQLPEQKKRIYQLAKVQGLSYKQISAELNISPNTVRNHLVEAVRLIRAYFIQAGMASLLPVLTLLIGR